MMMFLRWMVRQDAVDLGLWQNGPLTTADLIAPLDTHVASLGRSLGIIKRKANDWQTAWELTQTFRRLNPADPIRYDFALFGLGVDPNRQEADEQV
jgi:uncharacterized protein (TIGR02757 family)